MKNKPLPSFAVFLYEDYLKQETGKRKYVIKMPSGKYYGGETKEVDKENARPYFNQADAQKAANSIGGTLETVNHVS